MKNQLILGMSDKEYRALPGISRSDFVRYLESPWLLTEKGKTANSDSKALSFGRLVHMLVLESEERVHQEFEFYPDLKTRYGKNWDAFEERVKFSGKEPCLELELQQARKIKDSVSEHHIGDLMMKASHREAVLLSQINGVDVKVKFDAVHDAGDHFVIYDLKTTAKSASPTESKHHYYSYKYDEQEWFYSEALKNAFGKPVKFVFIFVEKSENYGVGAYEMPGISTAKAEQASHYLNLFSNLDLKTWRNYTQDKVYSWKDKLSSVKTIEE
jgi:hypothetical protein